MFYFYLLNQIIQKNKPKSEQKEKQEALSHSIYEPMNDYRAIDT